MIKLLNNNSIRSRMLSGFLLLTGLIILIVVVSVLILSYINRVALVNSKINQLEITTLSLFKVDNDFFEVEATNQQYFKTHQSSYLIKRHTLIARINTVQNYLRAHAESGVRANLQIIDSLFLKYDAKFRQQESLLFKKGFKDYGLEGKMRVHAHMLEQPNLGMTISQIFSLRRNEKDFFLRQDISYAHTLNTLVNTMIIDFQNQKIRQAEVVYHIKEYQSIFNKLASIQVQMGLSGNEGLRRDLNELATELTNKYYELSDYSYDRSAQARITALIFYSFIVIGAILFSIISGYWISKRLSTPIAQLSTLMYNIIVSEKKVKIDLTQADAAEEINILTKSFIHLISKTDLQMKEIRKKSFLLKKRNKDLKKLNTELDSFVYSTSHDLRSPLTSLLGLINIIKYENKQDELIPYFQMMNGSIERMEDFISQIVGYSKNKRLEIVSEQLDLYLMIAEVFDNHQFIQGVNKIDRFIDVQAKVPFCSDRGRIMILFNNLISNAIRYADLSKENPFIKATIVINEAEAIIDFSDNGVGIGNEHIDKIFNMFYRANTESKGSGLGLFIFKETITKLKGLVSVESTLGIGTKFLMRLPNLANPIIGSELVFTGKLESQMRPIEFNSKDNSR
jgi:signal transduction histidine kinase